MDKLPELVESFVSDHIGYKFVEPVQFDLGRIFSETDPSQPLLYTVKGPNEAASDIKKFAEEKEKSLAQFSMGGNNEIAIKQMIFKTLESGEKWILLENFQNAHDMRSMLKHHVKIGMYVLCEQNLDYILDLIHICIIGVCSLFKTGLVFEIMEFGVLIFK